MPYGHACQQRPHRVHAATTCAFDSAPGGRTNARSAWRVTAPNPPRPTVAAPTTPTAKNPRREIRSTLAIPLTVAYDVSRETPHRTHRSSAAPAANSRARCQLAPAAACLPRDCTPKPDAAVASTVARHLAAVRSPPYSIAPPSRPLPHACRRPARDRGLKPDTAATERASGPCTHRCRPKQSLFTSKPTVPNGNTLSASAHRTTMSTVSPSRACVMAENHRFRNLLPTSQPPEKSPSRNTPGHRQPLSSRGTRIFRNRSFFANLEGFRCQTIADIGPRPSPTVHLLSRPMDGPDASFRAPRKIRWANSGLAEEERRAIAPSRHSPSHRPADPRPLPHVCPAPTRLSPTPQSQAGYSTTSSNARTSARTNAPTNRARCR